MSEVKEKAEVNQPSGYTIVAAIIVVGIIILGALYVGLGRYYNSQQIRSLVEHADANGQSYSLVISNDLTGTYSFKVEEP